MPQKKKKIRVKVKLKRKIYKTREKGTVLCTKKVLKEKSDSIFDSQVGKTDALFIDISKPSVEEEVSQEAVFLQEIVQPAIAINNNILPLPSKKPFWKKFFTLNNRFFSVLVGLIFAGVFCAGVYVFAVPPASQYSPGETLDPNCAPGATNCTVTALANYSFGSNNFSGAGNFSTTGLGTFGAGGVLGIDDATNTAGTLKLFSAGANNYYTTFTAGTQIQNISYTLPVDDGTASQFLQTNGSGVLSWAGATASAGGTEGQVQFNYGGALGGAAKLTWDSASNVLAIKSGNPLRLWNSADSNLMDISFGSIATSSGGLRIDLAAGMGDLELAGDMVPYVDQSYTLGSNSKVWTEVDAIAGIFGKDYPGGTINAGGIVKLWSLGDNSYYTTLTTGIQSANATYTLPTAMPATSGYVLSSTTSGTMSWLATLTNPMVTDLNMNGFFITNGIQPGDSNFIGIAAGYNANSASSSNFLGTAAGRSATSAYGSNFLGGFAGENATNAHDSNFLGVSAGQGATGASFSNFFGNYAGGSATSAVGSNFFGATAGYNATGAYSSNFLGSNAGNGATYANDSNFLGDSAGKDATGAHNSNFLGVFSGYSATGAHNSNFLGVYSGYGATFATDSNFFGSSAGDGATIAYYSNFLGYQAGKSATSAHDSNFLGNTAGYGATGAQNSNFLGLSAGSGATNASFSNFFGNVAGLDATGAHDSNFFGNYSGNGATSAYNSNFMGYATGATATNANDSNFLGYNAGHGATYANNSNFFGASAGSFAVNAANAIFIGSYAGVSDLVNTVSSGTAIAIGRYSGTGGFKDSVAIGHGVINSAINEINLGNAVKITGIYASDTQSSALQAGATMQIGGLYNSSGSGHAVGVTSTGVLYDKDASSIRFKTDIKPMEADWLKILQAQPKTFTYISSGAQGIGYIAEDFDALGLKDLVSYDKENQPDAINYDRIPLYLLEVSKQQQIDINALKQRLGMSGESVAVSPAGTVGSGDVLGVFDQSIQTSIAKLGANLTGGIMSLKEIIADKATIKTAKIEKIEMVDSATGDAYCTWIENGEWQKVKGDCATATPDISIQTPSNVEVSENVSQKIEQIAQQQEENQYALQETKKALQETQNVAEQVQQEVQQVQEQLQNLEIVSASFITDINVVYGTTISEVNLPANINVVLSDNSVQNLGIVWDKGTPEYDGNTAGIYVFSGTLSLQTGITNTNNVKATVNIIVAIQQVAEEIQPEEQPVQNPLEPVSDLIQNASSSLLNGAWEFVRWIFSSGLKSTSYVPIVQKSSAGLMNASATFQSWLALEANSISAGLFMPIAKLLQ